MVLISVLALKFRGEDLKKKGLRREVLYFVLALTRVFRPGTGVYPRLGEHMLRNALQWHRGFYFLMGHNSRLGGTFLASGGTSSDLGSLYRNAPQWRRA